MATHFVVSGPLFSGATDHRVESALWDALWELSFEAMEVVLDATVQFRNPTGRYESLVHRTQIPRHAEILPGHLPYVAWLEGTSPANAYTGFPGYALFTEAELWVEDNAVEIHQDHLQRALA